MISSMTDIQLRISVLLLATIATGAGPAAGQAPAAAPRPDAPAAQATPARRPVPPTRDPHTPGFVDAVELPDGSVPPVDADGNFIIGPRTIPHRG
jgi:hypothetical protein